MFLTFSQLPNKYIIKSNKTQILNTQQKKIHQIRDQPKIREQQNKNHPRHHNNNKKIRDQREQADWRQDRPRASRSAIRRDDLGFDKWVWRMVRWFLGSRRSVANGFDDFWVCDLRNGFDDTISLSLSLSLSLYVFARLSPSFSLSLSLSLSLFGHCLTNEFGLGFSGFVRALGCGSISPSPVLGWWCNLSSLLSLSLFYFPRVEVI